MQQLPYVNCITKILLTYSIKNGYPVTNYNYMEYFIFKRFEQILAYITLPSQHPGGRKWPQGQLLEIFWNRSNICNGIEAVWGLFIILVHEPELETAYVCVTVLQ